MEFTFGIITNGGDLTLPLLSIRQLNIQNYEISIIGNPSKFTLDDVKQLLTELDKIQQEDPEFFNIKYNSITKE